MPPVMAASLTTTRTPGGKDNKKKKSFKTSHPKLDVAALHAHHERRKAELAAKYGKPLPTRPELTALAEAIENYLQREQDG